MSALLADYERRLLALSAATCGCLCDVGGAEVCPACIARMCEARILRAVVANLRAVMAAEVRP